jgi:transposase-like protein
MTESKRGARARYTLEFKQEAVRLVESGQSIAAAARDVGIAEQTLFNWIKAQRQGRLSGIASAGHSVRSKWRSAACELSWHASKGSATFWEKRRRTSPKA